MQKKLILLSASSAFFLLINSSCGKDDDPAPSAKTKTELITTGSWKYDKIDPAIAENYITCFKDNITTFTSDGKGTCPEAACNVTPRLGNFNWNFTDSETKLHLDATLIPSGSGDFTIVTLNETNMVLSQNITSPVPATITITFKH